MSAPRLEETAGNKVRADMGGRALYITADRPFFLYPGAGDSADNNAYSELILQLTPVYDELSDLEDIRAVFEMSHDENEAGERIVFGKEN